MARLLLARADELLTGAENAFLALASGLIAVLIVSAVFFRYFLNDPLTWTEEFIVIAFTWMLFVAFSSGFAHRMHLRIDAILLLLPRSGRVLMGALALAVTLVTLLGLVWFGTLQAHAMLHNQTPMMRISAAWAASAVPVCALCATVHVLRHALSEGPGGALWPPRPGGVDEGAGQ